MLWIYLAHQNFHVEHFEAHIVAERFNTSKNTSAVESCIGIKNVLKYCEVENTERALALRAIQSVFMHETRELNLIFIAETGKAYITAKGQAHSWRIVCVRVCGHTSK